MISRHSLKTTLITAMMLLTSWSSHAESPAMSISLHWGATPQMRIDLGAVGRDESGDMLYQRRLALYSTDQRELSLLRMDSNGESQTFCEKTLAGCIAIATIIGVGIFVFIEEFEDESRSRDSQTTVTFNSGNASIR